MKRVLIAVLALLLLAGLGVALSIDRIARTAIQRGATQALGVDTRVGFARLSPLAGGLHVHGLRIANPPGFGDDAFLRFDDLELRAELASLRSDVVKVPLFQLEGVGVSLERRGDATNTDAILANLKRFEAGRAPKQPVEQRPAQRLQVAKLVIRDIHAHVEWSALAAKQSALEVRLEAIELAHPGGERGLTPAELSNVVVKAVLDSVRRSGQLPAEVARNLAGGLRGLARLPISLTGGLLEEADDLLPGVAGDALGAAGHAVGEAGELLDRVLGGGKKQD